MRRFIDALRSASWLSEERVVAYAWLALAAHAGAALYPVVAGHGGLDVYGRPIGGDFLCFFAAGKLALEGHGAAAYDFPAHIAAQASVIPGATPYYFLWLYPPLFLLPMALLAVLPYGWALGLWLVSTATAYVVTLRRIVPRAQTWLVALAWPGFFDNVQHGQNGLLSTALLGGGLALLETRPLAAGMLLGALAYKPQLALLVPLALVAGGCWRALAATVLTALALGVLTAMLFGADVWPAFEASRHMTQGLLEGEHGTYYAKIGVFSAVRLAGGGVPLAWCVQAAATAVVAVLVVRAWRSAAPQSLKTAVLVAATPLATPWLNLYDLVIFALPAGWLIRDALRNGFRPWERATLALVCVAPIVTFAIAWAAHVQLAPAIAFALVAILLQRMRTLGADA